MVKRKSKVKTPRLLTKMNLRTIIRSKLQFLAVIFITALAMTLYVGLTSNAKSIDDRVQDLYSGSNIADIWTTTTISDEHDQSMIKRLVGPNGKTEGRFMIPAKIKSYSATGLLSRDLPTINKPYWTDNDESRNFFIVDERLENPITKESLFKDENGNYIDANVSFSIAGYQHALKSVKIKLSDNSESTLYDALKVCLVDENNDILTDPYLDMNFKVTGTMTFAENVQSSQMNNTNFLLSVDLFRQKLSYVISTSFQTPTIVGENDPDALLKQFVIDNNLLETSMLAIYSLTQNNQFVSIVDPNYNVTTVKENIQNYFKNKGDANNLLMCTELDMLSSNFNIQSDITQARQLAYIFPIIFFLVAILVVLTTISQIIIKDRIQIGTMKAIGLTNTRIVMHYIALGVYIVLIGVAIGMIVGPFIIPLIMNQKYDILYTLPAMKFTLAVPEALISTLICIVVTAIVSLLVVIGTVKLKPAEGMRPKEIKSVKASKKETRATKTSIPFRMAFRNIRLNLTKSLMVIFGITGCTALLVCGFGIDDTLNHGVAVDSNNFLNSDVYLNYNINTSLKDKIELVPGVERVEEYAYLPTTVNTIERSYNTFLNIFPKDSYFFHLDNYDLKEDAIISNKVAKQLNLKVGDEIHFSSISYDFTAKVGLILDCFYMHGIFVNGGCDEYAKANDVKTAAWVDVKDDANLNETIAKIKEVNGVSNAKSRQENIDLINSYMSSISLMTLAVKVFAILLAIVVLYNLSLLNFKERMRDIATLKVLGFSKLEISSSLIIESMVLTLIGVGFGLLLGLPMEILVLVVNLTPIVEFLYIVYPISYVISFILTIGTTLLVDYLLTFKIKGVKMVESLKSVE